MLNMFKSDEFAIFYRPNELAPSYLEHVVFQMLLGNGDWSDLDNVVIFNLLDWRIDCRSPSMEKYNVPSIAPVQYAAYTPMHKEAIKLGEVLMFLIENFQADLIDFVERVTSPVTLEELMNF